MRRRGASPPRGETPRRRVHDCKVVRSPPPLLSFPLVILSLHLAEEISSEKSQTENYRKLISEDMVFSLLSLIVDKDVKGYGKGPRLLYLLID